jgi:hypothetical protein
LVFSLTPAKMSYQFNDKTYIAVMWLKHPMVYGGLIGASLYLFQNEGFVGFVNTVKKFAMGVAGSVGLVYSGVLSYDDMTKDQTKLIGMTTAAGYATTYIGSKFI